MSDTIRMDLHELDELFKDLRRLSGDIEEIGAELRLVQYRLCGAAEEVVGERLTWSRRSLLEMGEKSEAAARGIMRSAEQFAACERTEKRRFEDQISVLPTLKGTFLQEERQRISPFTPKNVHFVRMSVSEGDGRI